MYRVYPQIIDSSYTMMCVKCCMTVLSIVLK